MKTDKDKFIDVFLEHYNLKMYSNHADHIYFTNDHDMPVSLVKVFKDGSYYARSFFLYSELIDSICEANEVHLRNDALGNELYRMQNVFFGCRSLEEMMIQKDLIGHEDYA